jgi:AcrR family transcriptional regulator
VAKSGDKRVSTPTWERMDPLSSLHPTAQRILQAARRILVEKGLSGLTFDAIARESGQYKGSISYFFGDKDTLIAMLADLVGHDTVAAARARLDELSPGPERIHEAIAVNEQVSRNSEDFSVFLDIAAQALHTERLRKRMARLYESYRSINRAMLDGQEERGRAPDIERLATLSLAIVDGLSLQYALDPTGFDPGPYWQCWEELVVRSFGGTPSSEGCETGF